MTIEQFWAKTDKSGGPTACWKWHGTHNQAGYGVCCWEGKREIAHRFAYRLTKGPIEKGLWVLHTCDNPGCVNPAHLYQGNAKANARDRLYRMRDHQQKVGPRQVYEVFRLYYDESMNQAEIGTRIGVSNSEVSSILRGRVWRDLVRDLRFQFGV